MALESPHSPASRPSGRPLVLAPFRGLRFDPAVAGDLGTVVSPPYDMLDAATVKHLEEANSHNVVRLILSRYFEPPYRAVRRRLEKWRSTGYLVVDTEPGLYLYEYAADGRTVRGMIGLVGLRTAEERIVLPHEDVMPGPVADRILLMRTTETNLEPILLVHEGSAVLTALYEQITTRAAVADFAALDESTHRLWRVTAASELDAVAGALVGQSALIADGHHRYAAYLALEKELGTGDRSPWAHGLAMLVPDDGSTLEVRPIFRVVSGLTLADIVECAEARGDQVQTAAGPPRLDGRLPPSGTIATLWLSDGRQWLELQTRRTSPVDVQVLHDALLPAWGVDEAQVGYHHDLGQALLAAQSSPSVVVIVRPPSLAEVVDAAARGVRLPRKSTSFSPKPRMGLVMRDLREG